MKKTELERFMDKVEKKENGCWEWTGARNRQEYGIFHYKKCSLSHRVIYQLLVGEIGNNLVLHKCDNPPCVNTDHLYLGNNQDNMRDKVAAQKNEEEQEDEDGLMIEIKIGKKKKEESSEEES